MSIPLNELFIVDAHTHLWDLDKNHYPWLADPIEGVWFGPYDAIVKNYLVPDFLKDVGQCQVAKTVHLQAMFDPPNHANETRWLQEQADQTGYPNAIIGFADFSQPDVERVIEDHMAHLNLRGIRMDLNWHEEERYRFCDRPDYMRNKAWLKGFELLEKHNLSFELQIYANDQADDAISLMQRFPNVPFVLNHLGLPYDKSSDGISKWQDNLERLAENRNLKTKVSGLDMFDHRWTVESIAPYVEFGVSAFGFDRCMFASNFPVSSLYGSYTNLIASYLEIFTSETRDNIEKFFSGNASTHYRV